MRTGSRPQLGQLPGASEHAVAVKPIHQFNQRWLALLERVRRHPGRTRIAVIGAGAGGVELLLAMQYRLRNELKALARDPQELEFHLFAAGMQTAHTQHGVRRRSRLCGARGVACTSAPQ